MQNTILGMFKPEAVPKPPPRPDGGYLVVDLFCSIGGVSQAAKNLGHKVVLAIDYEAERLEVHRNNHPDCHHECIELGAEDSAEFVTAKIRELVPKTEWHRLWIHGSPPCTMQSGIRLSGKKRASETYAAKDEDQQNALKLVQWTLNLIVSLDPPHFSFEEVTTHNTKGAGLDGDKASVQGLLAILKRKMPKFLDFHSFQMADFGVPQMRHRLIASRPATIYQLRHAKVLRVDEHVTTFQALSEALVPPPSNAAFIQGPHMRKPNREAMKPAPQAKGKHTDSKVELYDIRLTPGPTIVSRKLAWCTRDYFNCHDADKTQPGYLSVEQTLVLMTFPLSFFWHDDWTDTLKVNALGNAIPPLFVEAIFRAGGPL